MTTPMTDDAIAAAEACIRAATPAEDTGHSVMCDCPECSAAWARGALLATARHELAATHAPALLAEVRRLREALDVSEDAARILAQRMWALADAESDACLEIATAAPADDSAKDIIIERMVTRRAAR